MNGEKFRNTFISIKGILGLIEAKDIAIPEIQRPFVWKNSQVRDLIDSLYGVILQGTLSFGRILT